MQELGIKLEFGCSPNSIQKQGDSYHVNCTHNNSDATVSQQLSFNSMAVLQAAGRGAFIKNLQLEAAAIIHEKDRIVVNEYQQTNIEHIYAVGDVTNRVNLTPVAVDEGRAVADNLFAGVSRVVNHEIIATAVFTQPEFACVGLSEEEATNKFGIDNIVIYKAKFRSLQQALPAVGPRCILKLVVAKTSNRILGCHMVGNHAAEIIQMAAIAVGMGATKADFDRTMALHPSISEEFVTMI
jgi:glutathione reductase (NADPH)